MSLQLLDLASPQISYPAYCSIARAVLGTSDVSLHFSGGTGNFKSELAALHQQHFGSGLTRLNLPGSWTSTSNFLEWMAFLAADALFVIDDYCPAGSQFEQQRLHGVADRVFRSQGNSSSRGRLTSDLVPRASRPPRCLMLSTGEDTPPGQSLRARMLVLEIGPGDVDKDRLTECQRIAAKGHYAEATSGFVQWVAQRKDDLLAKMKEEVPRLRERAATGHQHRRTPDTVASLFFAFQTFLSFAADSGAITKAQAEEHEIKCWDALGKAAAAQGKVQREYDPSSRFFELLRAALSAGKAHVADRHGNCPTATPAALGWSIGGGFPARGSGQKVGWIDGDDLYLDLNNAFAAVQERGEAVGKALAVSPETLLRRLDQAGLLASKDTKRERLKIRRNLEGVRRDVVHVRARHLLGAQPSQPSQAKSGSSGTPGPVGPQGRTQRVTAPGFVRWKEEMRRRHVADAEQLQDAAAGGDP